MPKTVCKISALPEGLTYYPEFLSADEESNLIRRFEDLPYREIRMHGVVAKRTTVHYGWDYDYEGWKILPAEPIPQFLRPLIERVTQLAPATFEEALISRYPPGAAIGWHRDAPMFGSPVAGLSLGSECTMKFRRKRGDGFEVVNVELEPRSLYILSGPARTVWQHSIRRTKDLRYSITLRTLNAINR